MKSKQDLKILTKKSQLESKIQDETTMGSELEDTTMGSETSYTTHHGTNMGSEYDHETPTLDKVTIDNLKPKDLIGRTIILDQEDGTRIRAKILKSISESDDAEVQDSNVTKFLISMGKEKHEELLSYQQILDHINRDMEDDRIWKFRSILGHQQGQYVSMFPTCV